MQFASTRNADLCVPFSQAVLDCLPTDGGLYVPAYEDNLSQWILYMNEETSFSSIAGALTSALIKEEFSPIISEAISSKAFTFSPKLVQLDDMLFHLELFHGPTGSYKDFGISYLASCLEHILLMQEKEAIVLAHTTGSAGACIAESFRGKKRLKAILLYSKGTMRGLDPATFYWNGGNIYPVEINGTKEDCIKVLRDIYSDKDLVKRYGLTLANTSNIGRLLPQTFFYVYAFSRLKKKVYGDIYYALSSANYDNLVAGLYAWKFSLPVNGFITDGTSALGNNPAGSCEITDSRIPMENRGSSNPIIPANLERLENIFSASPAVMRGLVFPSEITPEDQKEAAQELYTKYNELVSPQTADAYAAVRKSATRLADDDSATVLISRNHPAFYNDSVKRMCGQAVELPENLKHLFVPNKVEKTISPERTAIINILHEIK